MTAVRAWEPSDIEPLTVAQTRIHIPDGHRLGSKRPPRLGDALDFWQFAGAAANVAMQMARPGVGHGVAARVGHVR